jgi:asparagine synthase (glutamine-hydrolysing)
LSGLVALVAHGGAPVDASLLQRMVASQRFRGPDGESTWTQGSVGLGHTMHRTTVEAEREVSPAALGDRLFITADARVDARDELCARLRDHGREPRTDAPDPELLLHAYDAWGEGCFEHLLGDFSFALWDAPRRKLVCAVDQLGVKPFYYADRGELFVGANSLACVRLHPEVRDELNDVAVGDFLLFGSSRDRDVTIYADVARIPPGHFLVVQGGALRLQRYFTLPLPVEAPWPRPAECVERFQELLATAVADRLRAPKVAIYMSGGVDSPLVAMTAKRELAKRFPRPELRAFTCVYDHLIADEERPYAELAARSLGIPVDVEAFDDGQLFDWVGRIAPAEPVSSIVLGPRLDQLARLARHAPTVLTGFDGDALLRADLRLHVLERLRQGRWGALGRDALWYARNGRGLPPFGLRSGLARRRAEAWTPRRPSWLREDFWRGADLERRWAKEAVLPRAARSREPSAINFAVPAWGRLFENYDPGCLGQLIEARHPLADLRVVRFAFGLPAVPWCVDKHLLRCCLGGLPDEIRTRPKTPVRQDAVVELVKKRGLVLGRLAWRSDGLSRFVDVAAAAEALGHAATSSEDFLPLLRAVALGAWLRRRDAGAA